MITKRIARNGMRGRKRATFLLVLVLSFTFIFIVTAVLLETSMKETKENQRKQLYGTWHAAYLGADMKEAASFLAEPELNETAVSYIIGTDASGSIVGSIPKELISIGKLKLKEGRLPEGPDEIIIEESAADSFGLEHPVGEKVRLDMESVIVSENNDLYLMEQYNKLEAESGDSDEPAEASVFRRLLADKERQDDLLLTLNSSYSILKSFGMNITPEEIEEKGLLYEQTIEITKEYVITGVISSFSGFWDTGSFPMAEVFVSQEEAQNIWNAIRQTQMTDLSQFQFSANIFACSDRLGGNLYDALKDSYVTEQEEILGNRGIIPFRRNTYTYPETGSDVEETLIALVILIIFIVTVCAILQIFLTQMKQRTRKIALLKSIGTTDIQVCAILFWEGVYLLLYSLPAGLIIGFSTGYGAIALMNRLMGMEISFYVQPAWIGLGIFAGCAALFAGMMLPAVKALRVPLVGTISVSSRKPKKSVRKLIGEKKVKKRVPLDFKRITKSHNRINWKNNQMIRWITGISCLLVFGSFYLGYHSFDRYHEVVTDGNRPDYVLSADHYVDEDELGNLTEELAEEAQEIDTVCYHQLNEVYLKYDGMEDSPLIRAYKELLPQERYGEFIGAKPPLEKEMLQGISGDISQMFGSISVTLYTVAEYGELYGQIRDMVTEGEMDEESFLNGESVIVAIPMYLAGDKKRKEEQKIPAAVDRNEMFGYVLTELGGFELSYDKNEELRFLKDTSLKPGEMVDLFKRVEAVTAGPLPISYDKTGTKIAGIIYYIPKETVYPMFADHNGFSLIASDKFMPHISGRASRNPIRGDTVYQDVRARLNFLLEQCPTVYGETHMNIYTSGISGDMEQAARVIRLGKKYGFGFTNYKEENQNLYYRAMNNALILGILGGTSLLIALMILWNIHMSSFEQERNRIGVLQSLGVENREIAMNYWKEGGKNAAGSLLLTHMILFGLIFISQGNTLYLNYYPWPAHIVLCIVFFIMIMLVHCGPVRELKKYAPTENILA